MKIIVLLKPTPDTEAKINTTADAKTLDLTAAKYVINPYDEFAIEEGLKIKEQKGSGEVVLVSVCGQEHKEVIIKGLAMGADRAILIDVQTTDSLTIANCLQKVMEKENPDLILGGRHAIDDDNMHVLAMLGGLLDIPSIHIVTKVEIEGESLRVCREIESGQVEVYSVKTPCILGAHKSLNSPRYTSLPGIMKARKKTFDIKSIDDLGVSLEASKKAFECTEVLGYELPAKKSSGKIFKGQPTEQMVKEVVKLLREEAKII